MHSTAVVMTWVAAVAGAGSLIYSLVSLRSRDSEVATWRALGRFWMAVFILVETGPRLAGWPDEVVLALSVLAFVPLLLSARMLRRA